MKDYTKDVERVYNALPDNNEDAFRVLIGTTAIFIKLNVNTDELSYDDEVKFFTEKLIKALRANDK